MFFGNCRGLLEKRSGLVGFSLGRTDFRIQDRVPRHAVMLLCESLFDNLSGLLADASCLVVAGLTEENFGQTQLPGNHVGMFGAQRGFGDFECLFVIRAGLGRQCHAEVAVAHDVHGGGHRGVLSSQPFFENRYQDHDVSWLGELVFAQCQIDHGGVVHAHGYYGMIDGQCVSQHGQLTIGNLL